MKVLQIIDKLDVGGAERVFVDLSNILDEHKINVTVLCLLNKSRLDSELSNTVNKIYLKRFNKFNVLLLYKLYQILKTFDIIHVHSRHVLRYVGLITFLPKYLRPFKIVFHDHSLLPINHKVFADKLLYTLLRKVDGVIMVCDAQESFYPNNSSIYLLENIIRTNKKHNTTVKSNKRLVAIGNFRRIKNYEFMIEIISNLPNDYKLDIYVNSIDEVYFGENKESINRLVKNNQLQIIIGEVNLQEKLKKYSLGIHTSLSESGPLVAIEYLSVGLPLVMYNTGAVAKRVKIELPFLIKQTIDKEDWIDTIVEVCTNQDLLQSYSKKLSVIYNENYSEENYTKACLNIYKHILNS